MRRTREEFIALHSNEFAGLLMDALAHERKGGELSVWIRRAFAKIEERLGRAYDDLIPKEGPKK